MNRKRKSNGWSNASKKRRKTKKDTAAQDENTVEQVDVAVRKSTTKNKMSTEDSRLFNSDNFNWDCQGWVSDIKYDIHKNKILVLFIRVVAIGRGLCDIVRV